MKKFLYFQPEYVGKFKCDGEKCNARCCKDWAIFIDEASYKKYPAEIQEKIQFKSEHKKYLMTLNEKKFCPMLTENNLCRLQRDYGEDFLSITCTTYPRYTFDFGKFFERSLTLSCPVAAELVLFEREPMKFEFVEVPEKIHNNGGKIYTTKIKIAEGLAEFMIETQIAMISILQERTLTIDQRLIVLGFFLDKLQEIYSSEFTRENFDRLIAAYESKKFLREQVPRMLRIFSFDSRKFIGQMLKFFEIFYGGLNFTVGRKFIDTVADVLEIKPDENNFISGTKIAANYDRLVVARKNFLEEHSNFLENFLVNKLFMNCYPWRYDTSIVKNYGVFIMSYKIFELIFFSATRKGFTSKEDLLSLVSISSIKSDHMNNFENKIFEQLKDTDDIFPVMESLLEP